MRVYKREKYLKRIRGFFHDTGIIKVITGVRRCGKSCLMQSIADELSENGISKEQIIYINLDKKGYRSIKTPDELEAKIDELCISDGTKYLFIDEVQNVRQIFDKLNDTLTASWDMMYSYAKQYYSEYGTAAYNADGTLAN